MQQCSPGPRAETGTTSSGASGFRTHGMASSTVAPEEFYTYCIEITRRRLREPPPQKTVSDGGARIDDGTITYIAGDVRRGPPWRRTLTRVHWDWSILASAGVAERLSARPAALADVDSAVLVHGRR